MLLKKCISKPKRKEETEITEIKKIKGEIPIEIKKENEKTLGKETANILNESSEESVILENKRLKEELEKLKNKQQTNKLTTKCESERDEFLKLYPNVDLKKELENELFSKMLFAGIDFKTAFETVHKDEILTGLINYTIEKTTEKVLEDFKAKSGRPTENAASKNPTYSNKTMVSNLSKKQREDIERRVMRGENISF